MTGRTGLESCSIGCQKAQMYREAADFVRRMFRRTNSDEDRRRPAVEARGGKAAAKDTATSTRKPGKPRATPQSVRRILDALAHIEPNLSFRLLDVGARGGLAMIGRDFPLLTSLPGFEAVAIEPDPEACETLRASGEYSSVYPVAVADRPGPRTLYITRNAYCASIYPPNARANAGGSTEADFDVLATADIDCATLDSLFSGERFDFLKIDVQGANQDVLIGGREILKDVVACWTDSYLEEVYDGIALFPETDALMRSEGFRLSHAKWGRRDGYVRQGNVVYTRDLDRIECRQGFLRLLVSAAVCGQFDLLQRILVRRGTEFLNPVEATALHDAGDIPEAIAKRPLLWEPSGWTGLDLKRSEGAAGSGHIA